MAVLLSPITFLIFCLVIYTAAKQLNQRPNIVFILTDDQDVELGSMKPMVKAKKLIGDAGVIFKNMFVTSPLCCPSRSSILTGSYVHNHGAVNNSISGNCSSAAWQASSEMRTFATYLKKQHYRTFFAGKYLNQYGKKEAGGVGHVPPGWNTWMGLVGNSVYYNYTLSVDGKSEIHGDNYNVDYLTDVIARRAEAFLKHQHPHKPFFMMLSTPACHAPFTPAPQYSKSFSNVSAPRTGSFNYFGKDKHWLVRQAKHPLGDTSLKYIDSTHRNRWRTLLSVDDLVELVMTRLDKHSLLSNTYVVFTSDNGFHLGQMSLPNDKRQLYEFDVRVPLMVTGPRVTPGQVREEIILNIDLAPTFLEMAGLSVGAMTTSMDGRSFLSLLGNSTWVDREWREDFLVEHKGEYKDINAGCPQLDHQQVANCFPDCVCEDSFNNTYTCVRTLSKTCNLMYCEFADHEGFVEVYDLNKDPHQLKNIAKTISPQILVAMNKRLVKLSVCSGDTCRATAEPWQHWVTFGVRTERLYGRTGML
ncbi:hypothetical protein NP493_885g01003 [Ridgeia piscesae]|uniref:Sulfatase N-terminal domain-containing protein n=1 Tax=Ridgeia piscesae TaxID=27915 RepID=A0AAD9KKU1_RIDPI|nr:hypothetical protein NP493_885g01003 [Ridgeia piscesae]